MNIARYVASGGTHCPDCGSPDIVGGHIEVDAGNAYQEITCNACDLVWEDQYELVGIVLSGDVIQPSIQDLPVEDDLDDDDDDTLEEWDLMDDMDRAAALRQALRGEA